MGSGFIRFYLIVQVGMNRPQIYVYNTLVELVQIIREYNGDVSKLVRISDNMYMYLTDKFTLEKKSKDVDIVEKIKTTGAKLGYTFVMNNDNKCALTKQVRGGLVRIEMERNGKLIAVVCNKDKNRLERIGKKDYNKIKKSLTY